MSDGGSKFLAILSNALVRGLGRAVRGLRPVVRGDGPVVREKDFPASPVLARSTQSHNEAMLALPHEHWEDFATQWGLDRGQEVLDLGCGAGPLLPTLARLNRRVVGIDPDEHALAMARANCARVVNVELRHMVAESLDYEDASFDAITCLTVLPYLKQPAAVAEMARVLRPGGRLVLGTVGSGYYTSCIVDGIRSAQPEVVRYGLDPLLISLARTLGVQNRARHSLRAWTPRAVRRLLEENSFAVDRVSRDVAAVDPNSRARFWGMSVYFIVLATRV